jgi:hypothetical protein
MAYPTDPVNLLGIWVTLAWMLMIYSYMLYKETPIYRLVEHVFVGESFAVTTVVGVENTRRVAFVPLIGGNLLYLIPIIMGARI